MVLVRQPKTAGFRSKSRYDIIFVGRLSQSLNRKSISYKTTHRQSLNLQAV